MRTEIIGYDRSAPRRAVRLSLNEDLLVRVQALTGNLSGIVEELLSGYVQQENARRRTEDETFDHVVSALNKFHEQHGFLSDEFSNH